MPIMITKDMRIARLEQENAALRALVGSAPEAITPEEPELLSPEEIEESLPPPSLVEQTASLTEAVELIADIIL